MAGLNTKSGQRNAPSPYSANAGKVPLPKQKPGGGSTLEKKGNIIELKAKPNTSTIFGQRVAEDFPGLDVIRQKDREDLSFYGQIIGDTQRNNLNLSQQDALFKSRIDANKSFVGNEANMNLAKLQTDASNLNNTRDNNTRLQQTAISTNASLEQAKIQDGISLKEFYAKNLQSALGYGASISNQNYEYWK